MKRVFAIILALILLPLNIVHASGFCSDSAAINEVCQSVMKLEVKNSKGAVASTASGFIAFDDQTLVTNQHVIENVHSIIAYSDSGEKYVLDQVLCVNSDSDIAILRFKEPTGLKPLELNEDGKVYRASPVVAIGSPQGFANTVSKGNVSSVYTDDDGISYIQFNAAISAGSSGGVLLNDDGKVIGITSSTYRGAAQNLNRAVSIIELIELYTTHMDDEPVGLNSWGNINQGAKEQSGPIPDARSFTIKNDATFSISEVYLYPDHAGSWGKARNTSGWLYKGNSMEFTVTDDEIQLNSLWTLNFCFYLKGNACYMERNGLDLRIILGKTLIVTIENGNYVHVDIEE